MGSFRTRCRSHGRSAGSSIEQPRGDLVTPYSSGMGRFQLVRSSGLDDHVDPDFATALFKAGPFFWLDLDQVPANRLDEFFSSVGLDPDSEKHFKDVDVRTCFHESRDGVRSANGSATAPQRRRQSGWRVELTSRHLGRWGAGVLHGGTNGKWRPSIPRALCR